MKRPSDKIIAMIKTWEGCRLTAYCCPAGVWTIGYGHTGADVKPDLTITEADAHRILIADIDRLSAHLNTILNTDRLNQNQFDALLSLAFNIGLSALNCSTLLRKVRNDPNDRSIAAEFSRWIYAAGRPLPGLIARRSAESALYFR